jgi:hypothetical protein
MESSAHFGSDPTGIGEGRNAVALRQNPQLRKADEKSDDGDTSRGKPEAGPGQASRRPVRNVGPPVAEAEARGLRERTPEEMIPLTIKISGRAAHHDMFHPSATVRDMKRRVGKALGVTPDKIKLYPDINIFPFVIWRDPIAIKDLGLKPGDVARGYCWP